MPRETPRHCATHRINARRRIVARAALARHRARRLSQRARDDDDDDADDDVDARRD